MSSFLVIEKSGRIAPSDSKVYEKPVHKPFKSVSEYFKLLEQKTGVSALFIKFEFDIKVCLNMTILIHRGYFDKKHWLKTIEMSLGIILFLV